MSRIGVRIAKSFELLIRAGVGCFLLIVVFIVALGIAGSFHSKPPPYHPAVSGPRQPIPSVNLDTLTVGSRLYETEGCSNCYGHIGDSPPDGSVPDLTHEGQRNASIEWQIRNLKEHQVLFPHSSMSDYSWLSPHQLQALASYMATRR